MVNGQKVWTSGAHHADVILTFAQRATPADEVIQQMAGLLVELVKLTPTGFEALAEADPDSALQLLAEANDHLAPIIQHNETIRPDDDRPEPGNALDRLE